ncbi:PP2C family protein-serine/threonine phosphatase [Streptomyces sp. NPDC090025]|uniref:PP2C family protein-serine/threonine phosphatase n=1 Tax=Streptomyces sp. NPDC090025 TaxID=3365922 RepID=UPI0038350BA9
MAEPRDGHRLRYREWSGAVFRGTGLPLLAVALVTFFDITTGSGVVITGAMVIAPALAVASCDWRGTLLVALTGGAAVLALAPFDGLLHGPGRQYLATQLIAYGAAAACSVVITWYRRREKATLTSVSAVATTTRDAVLRPLPPVVGFLRNASVYLPAGVDGLVGGDFYDLQPTADGGVRVMVGDVQGKGLGAVATAASLLGTFRETGYHTKDLDTLARHLETRMHRHHEYASRAGTGDADRFATSVLVDFPPDRTAGYADLVLLGHEAPLIVSPDGTVREPEVLDPGLPLGLNDLAGGPPPATRVRLAPGDTLLLTTDGVTEARPPDSLHFFPLRDFVTRAVTRDPAAVAPDRLVPLVEGGVLAHCQGRLTDDLTIFAVQAC